MTATHNGAGSQTKPPAGRYGGICRIKFFWTDVLLVTDPLALGTIMGRGEHAIDKAFVTYAPINKVGGWAP